MLNYYASHMKLTYKLLISHLILILAPILIITFLFYTQLFNIIIANTKDSEQNMARETVSNIENMLDNIRNVSSDIVADKAFAQLLTNGADQTMENDPLFDQDLLSFSKLISAKADGYMITDIKIYLDASYEEYYTNPDLANSSLFRPISEIQNSYWYGIFSSTNKRLLLCPTLYLTTKERENSGELSFTRKIAINNGSSSIYISVYFNKTYLNSMLKKYATLLKSSNYIVNERDSLVATSSSSLAGEYLVHYNELPTIIPNVNTFKTTYFSGERCYISYKEINGANWSMVSVIPANSIWSENKILIVELLGAYLLVLVFACFVSLLLAKSIVGRISTLSQTMKSVKTGTPAILDSPIEHDEIGYLIETYNYMVTEIYNLSAEQEKTASELRTAEFRALQAQINPHFLYNILDMINWLSIKGLNQEVSDAVQALSKFYKITLRKGNLVVTIEEELEHVSLYIQLQNMRYNGKIHYIIDIPDTILDYTIPKIIFQPVVENAIQHGIFGRESKEGNIVITGWLEENTLIFLISDDGVGIKEEMISQLLTGQVKSSTGSGVGISNTHKRLQLFYDTQFGLSYNSKEGKYTEVEIRIPAIK